MKTTGNTILITGAGTGIGLEVTKLFSHKGNRVIMVARDRDRLKSEASHLPDATTYACDISDPVQIDGLVEMLHKEHDDLNVIFLNAAVTNNYQLFSEEDAYEHAKQEMVTNYLSAVRLTQKLEKLLGKKHEAAIIITTSGVAFVPDIQNPTYSATKSALHSLVQSIRLVLENKGSTIKVFELMAPLVDSPFAKDVKSDVKIPPKEVADALLAGLGSQTTRRETYEFCYHERRCRHLL